MITRISAKIITVTIGLVFLCSVAFLWLSIKEHEKVYKETVSSHLEAFTNNLSHDLVPLMASNEGGIQVATKLLNLEEYGNVRYAIVYDKSWQLIRQYISPKYMASIVSQKSVPSFNVQNIPLGLTILNGELISVNPIGNDSYVLGYLVVVNEYDQPLEQANLGLIKSSAPVAALILIIMVSLAISFNRYLLTPLSRLTSFTESIKSSRDYGLRYQYKGNDEVAHLSENINEMLARIEEQDNNNKNFTNDLIQNKVDLEYMAKYDTLTKLPNRKFFNNLLAKEMTRVKRHDDNLMVMFLDLDNFKNINDTLGHGAGDELLKQVASLANQQIRASDILARIGGDEFLILVTDFDEDIVYMSIKIAERIINSLDKQFLIGGAWVQTGVSIGIADAISSGYNPESIISNADIAMYQAKESGRNTFTLFQQQLQESTLRKMTISNSVVSALQNSEFEMHYQLKVGVDGQVNGAEALIRWNSQFDGYISPAEFIPVAEKSGKIMAISRWVISRVFSDFEAIQNMSSKPIVVSMNLSAYDISDHGLIQYIDEQAKIHNIDISKFEFEVTESAYLDNFEEANVFFEKIRSLGFMLALDDFGTGYSSLSYLTRIEIDTIKIDQFFVESIGKSAKDDLIIDTIISLAHKLNIQICAEGVETQGQLNYLKNQGCHQLQGYFYSKPCGLTNLALDVDRLNGSSVDVASIPGYR
jgi:diguanylate cyclase (GGDEF)-like protein